MSTPFPNKIAKKFAALKKTFSVTNIIYLSGRRHYGKRHVRRAILAWVKSAKAFLKVQAGTGDNLLEEDIREGFTNYCLWSTSRPECIDTDGELDMECLDSGMALFRENCTPGEALELSYRQAFGTDFNKDDIAVLMEE